MVGGELLDQLLVEVGDAVGDGGMQPVVGEHPGDVVGDLDLESVAEQGNAASWEHFAAADLELAGAARRGTPAAVPRG